MTDNLETKINQIKSEISNAEKIKAKAEVQREQALITLNKIVKKLKEEYNVNSLEEAEILLRQVKEKIDIRLSEAELSLKDFKDTFKG